jgi:hypothetical protein
MKYSSIYAAVVVAAAWVVVRLLDRAPLRALIADGVVIGILGLLIACPCYLRNKIVMGQMFYPILTSKLAADAGRTSADAESAMAVLRSLGMDGFILVGVLALFLEGLKRDRWTGAVAVVFLLVMMVQMGWSGANYANAMRYASAAWIPLLGMAGAAVAWAVARGGAPRLLALGVLFGAAVLGQGVLTLRNLPKLPVVLGLQNRDLYLADRVNTYGAIREAEAGLTPGKSVLLVEERVYYCRAPFLGASDIQGAVDFSVMKSAAEVRRFLEREAIGAIVVDRAPNAKIWRFRNLESRLGGSWPPPGVRLAETRGAASLYRVE